MESITDLNVSIGLAIQSRRRQLSLSQVQLAVKAGLGQAYISHVESGQRSLSLASLVRLGQALQTDVWQLFSESQKLCDGGAGAVGVSVINSTSAAPIKEQSQDFRPPDHFIEYA